MHYKRQVCRERVARAPARLAGGPFGDRGLGTRLPPRQAARDSGCCCGRARLAWQQAPFSLPGPKNAVPPPKCLQGRCCPRWSGAWRRRCASGQRWSVQRCAPSWPPCCTAPRASSTWWPGRWASFLENFLVLFSYYFCGRGGRAEGGRVAGQASPGRSRRQCKSAACRTRGPPPHTNPLLVQPGSGKSTLLREAVADAGGGVGGRAPPPPLPAPRPWAV